MQTEVIMLEKLVKTTSKVKVFYTGLNGVTLGLPLDNGLGPLVLGLGFRNTGEPGCKSK